MDKQTPDLQLDAAEKGRLFVATTGMELADSSEIKQGRPEQPAPFFAFFGQEIPNNNPRRVELAGGDIWSG